MFPSISSSYSGLVAAQTRINVAANNIANAHTTDFKKTRTIAEESSSGGVQVTLEKVKTPGSVVFQESDQGLIEQELSNVELEEEFMNLLIGQRSFEANLKAIEVQGQTLGSVLDIVE